MTIPEIFPLRPCAVGNGESENAMVKAAIRKGFIAPYSNAARDDWKANQLYRLFRLESVADTGFVMQETRTGGIAFKLPPQLADIDAKILRIALLVVSPDFS